MVVPCIVAFVWSILTHSIEQSLRAVVFGESAVATVAPSYWIIQEFFPFPRIFVPLTFHLRPVVIT